MKVAVGEIYRLCFGVGYAREYSCFILIELANLTFFLLMNLIDSKDYTTAVIEAN